MEGLLGIVVLTVILFIGVGLVGFMVFPKTE